MAQRLWYSSPARHWEEALPLGNGRIGAMCFGGGARERMALNEETLWSGYPRDTNRLGAAAQYARARELALAGRLHEAQTLIESELLGDFTQSYLPLGDLWLEQEGAEEALRRELSLTEALHVTEYVLGGVRFRREAFVSAPSHALWVRLTADRPGACALSVRLTTRLRGSVRAEGDRLTLDALAPSEVVPSYLSCDDPIRYDDEPSRRGMRCRAVARVIARGGSVRAEEGALLISGADELEVRLVARTSFRGYEHQPFTDGADEKALCENDLATLDGLNWRAARAAHIADHRAYYDRVAFSLGADPYDALPTDLRLREPKPDDNGLMALLFHYGRYLLIASSRPDGEPANLQGIWNQDLRAVWSCNYTININTEMNYWPAERVGLCELCEPLFRLIDGLCDRGRETARVHYGARGAVSHHNTDLWRLTNPVGQQYAGFAGCAFWPMSLGWLCRSLWEHWRYTGDRDFLASRALPAIRAAARFYLDAATVGPDGYATLAPATSPENMFLYEGTPCKVSRRATMTTEILRETLAEYLAALQALSLDEPMAAEAVAALARLAPAEIDSRGRMLEWEREYEEPEPHHRHVSHLYGLYPGERILAGTPEAEACRRSLEGRGDDGTGWSLAWKVALWARLGDGDHALRLLRRQLSVVEAGAECNLTHGGSYISLLDAHPPFQIDGNLGSCAAIAELLLQTRESAVLLLPALPADWREGEVAGLRGPFGSTFDFAFCSGRVTRLRAMGGKEPLTVEVNGERLSLPAGGELEFQ